MYKKEGENCRLKNHDMSSREVLPFLAEIQHLKREWNLIFKLNDMGVRTYKHTQHTFFAFWQKHHKTTIHLVSVRATKTCQFIIKKCSLLQMMSSNSFESIPWDNGNIQQVCQLIKAGHLFSKSRWLSSITLSIPLENVTEDVM